MTNLLPKLTIAIFALIIVSCKKPDLKEENQGNNQTQRDYSKIPDASPVSSRLMVYAIENNQSTIPYYVLANNNSINYNSNYNAFISTGFVSLDKYTSTISFGSRSIFGFDGYYPTKTFTASNASKNYTNIKVLPLISAGSVIGNSGSGTIRLPNNGDLVLPPYSFGTPANPGSATSFWINAGFTTPSAAHYAAYLPCYPMADQGGKRWFLNSYGVYMLSPWASDNNSYNVDFKENVNVMLRMPIPTNLSSVPDTIPTWNINDKNMWQQNGVAVRNGNYYEKKITKKGFWNFAVPVNGVYTTFHLKANNGLGIPNVRYLIKNGINEVAEGRTDANGDGLVFIPTNKDLTIDLINDHRFNLGAKIQGLPFGNFNKASEISISLPARQDVVTMRGAVFDCDGKPITSGFVGIRAFTNDDEYLFPITDGKFSAAQWIFRGGFFQDTLTIYNNQGAQIYRYPIGLKSNLPSPSYIYNYDTRYYTCLNSSQLYCNYRIDSNNYSIVGNTTAISPELNTSPANTNDIRFNLSNNGKGIRFYTWFVANGSYGFIYHSNVTVDGVAVQIDASPAQPEIHLYRNDNRVGGFKEGWFSLYYKDNNGTTHNATGNFRIKIL